MDGLIVAIVAGAAALAFAAFLAMRVLAADEGTDRMKEIGAAIQEGANAFLKREYTVLAGFVVIVFVVLLLLGLYGEGQDERTAIAYLVGAVASALAGFVGMRIAVKANMRTASAARTGLNRALRVAFSSGGVMGVTVVGIGLLGAVILWMIFEDSNIVAGFSFGASSIALFARVGGGIYTKAADVGGDLAGKVEAGIPEDDPRQRRRHSGQRGRQRRRRGRHGRRPFRVLRRVHHREPCPCRHRRGVPWRAGHDFA